MCRHESKSNKTHLSAFFVHGPDSGTLHAFSNKKELLQLRLKGTFLFLDNNGVQYISKSFFFAACEMPFVGSPGSLYLSYMKAGFELIAILFFIFFVFLVVMALGNSASISPSNQLFATVAGTVLPKLLQVVLRTKPSPSNVDKNGTHFQTCLMDLLTDHEENWRISDIEFDNETLDSVNARAHQSGETSNERGIVISETARHVRQSACGERTHLLVNEDNEIEEIDSRYDDVDIVIYDNPFSFGRIFDSDDSGIE